MFLLFLTLACARILSHHRQEPSPKLSQCKIPLGGICLVLHQTTVIPIFHIEKYMKFPYLTKWNKGRESLLAIDSYLLVLSPAIASKRQVIWSWVWIVTSSEGGQFDSCTFTSKPESLYLSPLLILALVISIRKIIHEVPGFQDVATE